MIVNISQQRTGIDITEKPHYYYIEIKSLKKNIMWFHKSRHEQLRQTYCCLN